MLQISNLTGFGAINAGTDVTPNPITIQDIADAGFVASAMTNLVSVSGIDTSITLRLTLSAPLSINRVLGILRDGALVSQSTTGNFADVTLSNSQTLQFELTNALDLSTWSGVATLTNLSDAGSLIATFNFALQDTGSGGGGGGGGTGGGGEPP